MKGRTTCPKCKHEFVLDLPDTDKIPEVVCPKCNNKFAIQAKCLDPKSDEECSWEEHGEPRKTILSSIKPKTNRPRIAGILLICVFVIGITTAVFSEAFIESSLDIASGVGLTGSVEIKVIDLENKSIQGINVKIDGISGTTNEKGLFSAKNVELGILTLEVTYENLKNQTREILVTPFFTSESTIKMEEGNGNMTTVNFNATGCTLILVVFSVFALIGTITCLKRQHLDVSVAASLAGIFSFGFFLIGAILSIIALAIIITSKEEFENGKKGKTF